MFIKIVPIFVCLIFGYFSANPSGGVREEKLCTWGLTSQNSDVNIKVLY